MLSPKAFRSAGLAALVATGMIGGAVAADMPAPPPPLMHAAPPPLEVGGGFYLRGDIGVGLYDNGGIDNVPVIAGTRTISSSLGGAAFIGVGAGYAFNSWLRADATLEYRMPSKFRLTEETAGAPPGYNITSGRVSAAVGLVNGYIDLGTWHRITPFIGAGVGFASVMTSNVRDYGFGAFAGGFGQASNKTDTRLAWAIHAGLGYDLSPNWKAEVAYRYLNMGTVNTGNVICTVPCAAYNARIKDLDSHDIKVGMRYVFADAPLMAEPGPLVRKY